MRWAYASKWIVSEFHTAITQCDTPRRIPRDLGVLFTKTDRRADFLARTDPDSHSRLTLQHWLLVAAAIVFGIGHVGLPHGNQQLTR